MTDYAQWMEEAVQGYVFDGSDLPTAPTELYVALHDGPPGVDASENELAHASYDRAQTDLADWTYRDGPSPTVYENAAEIAFPTAQEEWPGISHASIWTGPDGSDYAIFVDAMDETVTVPSGERFRYDPDTVRTEVD